MTDTHATAPALIDMLRERAASYRIGGPSSEHTARMLDEAADTITRLTAEVERLTKGRETMGNLWARERAARVAAEAEVGWLEAARAPEMAEEITNLRAAQSNLIGTNRMLKHQVEDRDTTITRLTAEVERLKTSGIAEVASHNPSVMDWMKHWEARTLKAEADNERLRAALEPFANAWDSIPPEVFKWLSLAQLGKLAAHEISGVHFQRASAALKEPRT